MAVTDPLAGAVLDRRYRVDAVLARGGMSTVYYGTDLRLDRTVAVKVMASELARDPGFVDRFGREARAAAGLAHPNVVAVFDQGADEGHVFIVMELVRGRTLRSLLRAERRLDPALALTVIEPVLSGLAAAHRAGLVHRDIKPENVLIADDGTVKVVDFGLVRAVAQSTTTALTGSVLGTVSYVAPESVTRGTTDPRTDVYSTGILLYELLTGSPPYSGDTPISVAYRHVHDDVPPPSAAGPGIPEELDALVQRATRREPGARPVDAGAFLAELRDVREDLDLRPVPIPDPPAVPVEEEPTAGTSALSGPFIPEAEPVVPEPGLVVPEAGSVVPEAGSVVPEAEPVVPEAGAGPDTPAAPLVRRLPPDEPNVPPPPPPRDPERRRRRRRVLISVFCVALLVAGVAGAGWWFGSGRYTRVPKLVRLSVQDATRTAEAHHLKVTVLRVRRHSEDIPAGAIVSTEPGPGSKVRRGATVDIRLSSGPERFQVPAGLVGATKAAAVKALRPLPLSTSYSVAYNESVPIDHVVSVDPPAGSSLKRGQLVTVVLSQGPKPFPVPSVVGRSQGDAEAVLDQAGLKSAASEDFSDSVPAGSVISQEPDSGEVHRGDTVQLVVSKGPQLVAVPDVMHKPLGDARAELLAAGLQPQVHRIFGAGLGLVVQVEPGAGTMVPRGSPVQLTVV